MPIVCPSCRRTDENGEVISFPLSEFGSKTEQSIVCPNCRLSYPIIDKVLCIPPRLDRFLKALHEQEFPWPCIDETKITQISNQLRELEPGSPEFIETSLIGQYAFSHYQKQSSLCPPINHNIELYNLIEHILEGLGKIDRAIEVGCGPGGFLSLLGKISKIVVGLDIRFGMIRLASHLNRFGFSYVPFRTEGSRFEIVKFTSQRFPDDVILELVLGDILAPPFGSGDFNLVISFSLLDSVVSPIFALGQMDALLAPKGFLIIGSPWSWAASVTPPSEWWSDHRHTAPEFLKNILSGRESTTANFHYKILEERRGVPWSIPAHSRAVFTYFLDIIVAQKLG